MNETLFFILGISLVVVAVLVAVIGLRFERFPASRGLLVGATVAFACLVVGTGAFAWMQAEDEQEHREQELAEAAEETVAEGEEGQAAEEVGPEVAEEPTGATADEGATLFDENGCGGCHTLAAAGSTGTTGPDLDGALKGKDEAFIEESIVDPNAEVAKGQPPDVMPQTFGTDLTPEQIDALVQYLAESTSGAGGSKGGKS
jgi:mono/diheme cytochrome c family protein